MKLIVDGGFQAGTTFRLHDGINTLGREPGNRIRLFDARASRNHCKIRKVGQSLFLTDLGTRNGTLVNGKLVSNVELRLGDCIRIGNTVLRVADENEEPSTTVEKPRSASFLQSISMTLAGKRVNRKPDISSEELEQLVRKSRRFIWKLRTIDNSPEARRTTLE